MSGISKSTTVMSKVAFVALLSSSAFTVHALTFEPFSEARFKALQAAHKPVLIDVNAAWCSTCKSQTLVLDSYQRQYPASGITVLKVDFDDQKKWVRYFKAPRQSTFALYQGQEQLWFSVAETRASVIFNQLNQVNQVNNVPKGSTDGIVPTADTSAPQAQPEGGFFKRLMQKLGAS
ncbi:MAG: thioredoxin family protein [Pseudomonadota bacterium]|nr:thioredoxin family protein [Pseudomonadota bacterium]